MVLLEPNIHSGLEALLGRYKIVVQDDLIVDANPLNRLMGLGVAAPLVQPADNEHPIVKSLRAPGVMVTARSLAIGPEGLSGVDAEVLVETGETAWGETHIGADGTASRGDDDHLPPLAVAIAARRDSGSTADKEAEDGADPAQKASRLVVFGDGDWINNRYLKLQGNQDLLLNALAWAAEADDKITIRPKARAGSQLFLSGEDLGKLKFFSMDLVPVLLVALGLGIVLIRKQR